MESTEKYLQDLKQWLSDTKDVPLEEMADFFTKRLDGYEEHMAIWEKSYQVFAGLLPDKCRNIVDLGCGTGLELDIIWQKHPDIAVTGVDLCKDMLEQLQKKHPDKNLITLCQDYFQYDFGMEKWDAAISFESLHHFLPEKKGELYKKLYDSLKKDGVFLLGDYTACCEEEEELLCRTCMERREKFSVPENRFVHFDIPLTLEHEQRLMEEAGFHIETVLDNPDGATIFLARKL